MAAVFVSQMSVIVTESLRNQLKEDCAHLSDSTRLEPIVFWLSGFGSCRRAVQGSQRVRQRKMATGEQWKAGWACPKIVLKGTPQLPNFLSPGITSWSFYNFEKCRRLVKVSSIHGPLWGHLRYKLWWQCGNWTQKWLSYDSLRAESTFAHSFMPHPSWFLVGILSMELG